MTVLIMLLGILIAAIGILCMVRPGTFKKLIEFWGKGNRIYLAGVLRLVFAVIFLLGAQEARLTGVILAMGILFIIGGVSIFAMGAEKSQSIIRHYYDLSEPKLRILSAIPIVLGILIIYSV